MDIESHLYQTGLMLKKYVIIIIIINVQFVLRDGTLSAFSMLFHA